MCVDVAKRRYSIHSRTVLSDIENMDIIMDFDQLRHFVRIAELGSFSRAEAALDISQPSLSRQMRLLEESLQTKLFARTGRGVNLTPAGAVFFPHALAILEGISRAKSALAGPSNSLTGRIVVGLPPRIARMLTGPLVDAFRHRFPQASIVIAEGLSPILIEDLKLGRIEVALLFNATIDNQLSLEGICEEELVLIGPAQPKSPKIPARIRFNTLSEFPLILPPMPNSVRAAIETARQRTTTNLNVVVEVNTMHAILELVERQIGFSIVPKGMLAETRFAKSFTVTDIRSPKLLNTVSLATAARLPMTKLGLETHALLRKLDIPKLLGARTLDRGYHR
ncbi:LysR family transcriptional regulator [Bradyrhizobium sp. LHD-71]|uniref:LysR family transcriptional regulator n=1 Tax=Bradyrhizobium sp. LHD-71 TaxID=3072141 RepID=UPI00280DABFD|nr:LysR family transcriptional regulator [Bradyrhizobium sp. LHD-71]MDQ8729806.1 LysR family transcriptional regulator [Bradyrhizobium sp. LHD-71]